MSTYMCAPHITFAGRFIANVSTVNNNPDNFNLAANLSTADFTKNVLDAGKGSWNPYGTGAWTVKQCRVTNVRYAIDDADNGHSNGDKKEYGDNSDSDDDIMLLCSVAPSDRRTNGKLVDLDPDNQMVSTIFGMQIRLVTPDLETLFVGDYMPAAFQDICCRVNVPPKQMADPDFSAFYYSVLTGQWSANAAERSRVAKQLIAVNENKLSIRFTVDGFQSNSAKPDFTSGRIIGVIGAWHDGDPQAFPICRTLTQSTPSAGVNTAYATVDGRHITIDLCNSLRTKSPAGDLEDIGDLYVGLLHPDKTTTKIGKKIPYTRTHWCEDTAGLHSVEMTLEEQKQVESMPVCLVSVSDKAETILLNEITFAGLEGVAIQADGFVFRLNQTDKAKVTLIASKFGQRIPGIKISVAITSVAGVVPPPPGLTVEGVDNLITNDRGEATFTLVAQETRIIGNNGYLHRQRIFLDGQVFSVVYTAGSGSNLVPFTPALPALTPVNSNLINVLVWDPYPYSEDSDDPLDITQLTWVKHIEIIFRQYANLYPVMKQIVNLADYSAVTANLVALKVAFADSDLSNPHYMPVTRDMSEDKRKAIRHWLQDPVYSKPASLKDLIQTVEELQSALQSAISLELSTIPVYLTALYSIKPGHNHEVRAIIRGIVMEEMSHMVVACNLLNAINGTPVLDDPAHLPIFPGYLPGGILANTLITLGACTRERVANIYMMIEQPEEVAHIRHLLPPELLKASTSLDQRNITIGDFYTAIKYAFQKISAMIGEKNLFCGKVERQIPLFMHSSSNITISDLDSALMNIDKIIHQGEGTSKVNPTLDNDDLAHYYRFLEIYRGQRIIAKYENDVHYYLSNEKIVYNSDQIYPMKQQDGPVVLPDGSIEKNLLDESNEMYARLLICLNDAVNGNPSQLSDAIGCMKNLQISVQKLMKTKYPNDEQHTIGPNFDPTEFLPKKSTMKPAANSGHLRTAAAANVGGSVSGVSLSAPAVHPRPLFQSDFLTKMSRVAASTPLRGRVGVNLTATSAGIGAGTDRADHISKIPLSTHSHISK